MSISTTSLRIYSGTLETEFSSNAIVSVGNAPDGYIPKSPSIVDEPQSWMITHAQTYTSYSMFSQTFKTKNDQSGQLLICLFLPAQQRFADGVSPLGVLNALMDCFAIQALRGGVLPDIPVDSSPFAEVLKRYRMEERSVLLPVMQSGEPASYCVESMLQLDALMRHSRYPELSGVGRLEVGFRCKSTVSLFVKSRGSSSMSQKAPTERVVETNTIGKEKEDAPLAKKRIKGIAIVLCLAILILAGLMIINSHKDIPEPIVSEVGSYATKDSLRMTEETRIEKAKRKAEVQEAAKEDRGAAEVQNATEVNRRATEEQQVTEVRPKKVQKSVDVKPTPANTSATPAAKSVENSVWLSEMKAKQSACPIKIRLGVRITSIVVNSKSVTIHVSYDELTKYDMDDDDEELLKADLKDIGNKYFKNIPSNVVKSIILNDRAGRVIKLK